MNAGDASPSPGSRAVAAQRIAGALWIAAAVIYVTAEAVAAAAFPGYSYATNYISDLGVSESGMMAGRAIDSPLSGVMNTAFILQGVLFLAATVLAVRSSRPRPRAATLWIALSALHAFGIVLVGLVHGSEQAVQSGTIIFHGVGAALAIVCGNLAGAVGGLTSGRRWFRVFSVVVAAVGLLSIVVLQTHQAFGLDTVPDGAWERGSVYTIVLWEFVAGVLLVKGESRQL